MLQTSKMIKGLPLQKWSNLLYHSLQQVHLLRSTWMVLALLIRKGVLSFSQKSIQSFCSPWVFFAHIQSPVSEMTAKLASCGAISWKKLFETEYLEQTWSSTYWETCRLTSVFKSTNLVRYWCWFIFDELWYHMYFLHFKKLRVCMAATLISVAAIINCKELSVCGTSRWNKLPGKEELKNSTANVTCVKPGNTLQQSFPALPNNHTKSSARWQLHLSTEPYTGNSSIIAGSILETICSHPW